jgi:hypothetical protein
MRAPQVRFTHRWVDLAARKLAQYDGGARIPTTVSAITDAVRWAERTMERLIGVTR